jgi:hypothetical protein
LGVPLTKYQLRSFLGMAGFYQIWIPNSGVIAKPLYEATKRPDNEPLEWTGEIDCAYKTLKKAVIEAQALGIPNLTKLFVLDVWEKKGNAVGVLTPKLRTEPYPVAYLSKKTI